MHCRMFISSVSDLYPLDDSSTPSQLCPPKVPPDVATCSLGGEDGGVGGG